MLKYIVYITVNLCNGKFYIGVHRTNPEVFDGYIGNGIVSQADASRREQGRPLASAVKKYGYNNFKRTTIAVFPDTEEGMEAAYALEAAIVTETLIKSKTCYNVQLGGIISRHVTKRVYKFDQKGNFLQSYMSPLEGALSIPNLTDYQSARKAITNNCNGATSTAFGFVWSYEKKFISPRTNKKKVAQYTLSGKYLRYFDSATEAGEFIGILGSCVSTAIRKHTACGNYQWRFFTGDTNDITPLNTAKSKNKIGKVAIYDLDDNLIEIFENVNECVRKYPQLKKAQIRMVLNGTRKTHGGYKFKWMES